MAGSLPAVAQAANTYSDDTTAGESTSDRRSPAFGTAEIVRTAKERRGNAASSVQGTTAVGRNLGSVRAFVRASKSAGSAGSFGSLHLRPTTPLEVRPTRITHLQCKHGAGFCGGSGRQRIQYERIIVASEP